MDNLPTAMLFYYEFLIICFVSFFSNPTADKLNISLNDFSNVSKVNLTVYDYAGRRISQQSFTNNIFSLNVSNFTAGIYILELL